MIVFQAEHNILMHPFHMLGNFYASPTVFGICSTLQGFWVPRNLAVEKSRFETCLNGGSSFVLSLSTSESNKRVIENKISQKLDCIGSSEENASQTTENNPVPNRMAPRQLPGVYMILCLVNNKRYYGESKNVSARLSQHKSRLRKNLHEVAELQRDFNIYGEEHFSFSALWLDLKSTREQRSALEIEFIARFFNLCYNKFSGTNRKGENNPFFGRTHSPETVEQISRSRRVNSQNRGQEGLAVNVNGTIYPSISEASRQTNHSRDTLRRWLNDPKNLNCVAINTTNLPVNTSTANKGVAKKISLYGTIYSSITDASIKQNCSRANIQRLLRTFPDQCFVIIT